MNQLTVISFICYLATTLARPGYHGGGGGGGTIQLQGVPDLSQFAKLDYPQYNVVDLGETVHGSVPPTIVHITKEITVKQPQPYPVKIPHPYPVPVPVAKPYPVVETKIVKVPQPIPIEVIKKVGVPIEVPKPYPVPIDELKGGGGGGHNIGASIGAAIENSFSGFAQGHQQLADNLGGHQSGGFESYEGGQGGYGDHSQLDEAAAQTHGGWAPSSGGGYEGGAQQEEEH